MQDPLQQFQSPYVYAANNPIIFIDPTGMWTETSDSYFTNDPDEIFSFINSAKASSSSSTEGGDDPPDNYVEKLPEGSSIPQGLTGTLPSQQQTAEQGNNQENSKETYLTNKDPYATLNLSTKQGLGLGGKVSILGLQIGLGGDIYTSKRVGTISTDGRITSNEYKMSSFYVNAIVGGLQFERDWTSGLNITGFDVLFMHFENGKYPVFRPIDAGVHVIGGGSISLDLNSGKFFNYLMHKDDWMGLPPGTPKW